MEGRSIKGAIRPVTLHPAGGVAERSAAPHTTVGPTHLQLTAAVCLAAHCPLSTVAAPPTVLV